LGDRKSEARRKVEEEQSVQGFETHWRSLEVFRMVMCTIPTSGLNPRVQDQINQHIYQVVVALLKTQRYFEILKKPMLLRNMP
jgi:hypothetical protein